MELMSSGLCLAGSVGACKGLGVPKVENSWSCLVWGSGSVVVGGVNRDGVVWVCVETGGGEALEAMGPWWFPEVGLGGC